MKKSTIKLIAMLLTVVLMLPNFAGAGALNENEVDEFAYTVSTLKSNLYYLIDSGKIFDLGLYSSVLSAIKNINLSEDTFNSFGTNEETLTALSEVALEETDELVIFLLEQWMAEIIESTGADIAIFSDTPANYEKYTVRLSSYKSATGLRYIGNNNNPGDYLGISDFPNATKIGSASRSYNCVSYAWYLNGLPNSRVKLVFENYDDFDTIPKCHKAELETTDIGLPTARVGDIVVYRNYANGCEIEENPTHVAIITSIDANGVTVKSKWGIYGVYEHKLEESPYYAQYNTSLDGGTKFTIYKMSHPFSDTGSGHVCQYCGAHAY